MLCLYSCYKETNAIHVNVGAGSYLEVNIPMTVGENGECVFQRPAVPLVLVDLDFCLFNIFVFHLRGKCKSVTCLVMRIGKSPSSDTIFLLDVLYYFQARVTHQWSINVD